MGQGMRENKAWTNLIVQLGLQDIQSGRILLHEPKIIHLG